MEEKDLLQTALQANPCLTLRYDELSKSLFKHNHEFELLDDQARCSECDKNIALDEVDPDGHLFCHFCKSYMTQATVTFLVNHTSFHTFALVSQNGLKDFVKSWYSETCYGDFDSDNVFIDLLYEHSWILMSYIYWYGLTEYRNKIKQDVSLYSSLKYLVKNKKL
jgi:hypothetical protein